MNNKNDLTTGNILGRLVKFALPYLLAAFMQTFYGLADLFVVGLYNDSSTTTAVSIGSQVMHLITVVILGIAMGTTVLIGKAVGAKEEKEATRIAGGSIYLFSVIAIVATIVLECASGLITKVMSTPIESVSQTNSYLRICFGGLPFIIFYNLISSIFRGAGDSKRPMGFVAIACIINIILDFVFIGGFHLGAVGAALGTVLGQAVSVLISLLVIRKINLGFSITKNDIKKEDAAISGVLSVGIPIALQDGLIQVAFIVITIIANGRGLVDATAVGIVEKIICFLFLVPSAFLSAISAVVAQNLGAGKEDRARKSLYYGLAITMIWGILVTVYHQFLPESIVGQFTKELPVLMAGAIYIKSYSIDTFFAGIHFCFSGYFCGCQKSVLSFIHNIISIVLIRIPGAYFTSKYWPDTLYPMGFAAPAGSALSAIICLVFYRTILRKSQAEMQKDLEYKG